MKVSQELCPKRYWSVWRAVGGDGTADIRCQTVPTVPRAPTVEGESEAQADTQHRVCMLGWGGGRSGGQGRGWNRFGHQTLIWSLNPEVGQERASGQGRTSGNSGFRRNPLATVWILGVSTCP